MGKKHKHGKTSIVKHHQIRWLHRFPKPSGVFSPTNLMGHGGHAVGGCV